MGRYRSYSKEDQKLLATWSIECAQRVLPLFEATCPQDERPRVALETGRNWVRTGLFSMPIIRKASLDAHAAAKHLEGQEAASYAAHAAGQAVATAHVAQHAYGGALYALKAVAAANPLGAEENVVKEVEWQSQALPEHLRVDVMSRIIVRTGRKGLKITLNKSEGF